MPFLESDELAVQGFGLPAIERQIALQRPGDDALRLAVAELQAAARTCDQRDRQQECDAERAFHACWTARGSTAGSGRGPGHVMPFRAGVHGDSSLPVRR
jgi:hypothetical protein